MQVTVAAASALLLVAGITSAHSAETTRNIATKSFINKIDVAQTGQCSGAMAALLAAFTNCNFSENPSSADPSGQDFRLYSRVNATVGCDGDRVASWSLGKVDMAFGTEMKVMSGSGLLKEDVKTVPPVSGISSQQKVTFSYAIKGRPDSTAEPAFQKVAPRTCHYIWHRVEGSITCKAGTPVITANVIGSGFPSHRVWVDGQKTADVAQGPFSKLWECSASDSTLVR